MHPSFAALATLWASFRATCATVLPYVHKDDAPSSSAAKWWVHVGDNVYYTPSSVLGLSQDISNYWYARGSASALTEELRGRRVGGDERWHIFHLPREGVSLLQSAVNVSKRGDRRSSISALVQLKHGQVLDAGFDEYDVEPGYVSGLQDDMVAAEKKGVARITGAGINSYLEGLVKLGSRSYSDADKRQHAEEYLRQKFEKLNGKRNTCLQSFDAFGDTVLNNVITYIPGLVQDQGFIVVGAHFDSRPYDGYAPGANDNGSGVAAMLAILEAITKTGATPQKPIYFVGFAAEEPGCLGSESFVQALHAGSGTGLGRIGCSGASSPSGSSFLSKGPALDSGGSSQDFAKSAAIIMDEVGWVSKNLASETVNLETYDPQPGLDTKPLMDHVASAAEDYNTKLTVVHSNNPFGSDHMSFLSENIPAVLLINGDDENYPNYHTSADTMESVSSEYVATIARAAFGGVFRMAYAAPT